MYAGPLIFSQVMDFLPPRIFQHCVDRYQGNFRVKRFSCLDQFRTMAFAQLTYRESLCDIEACLRTQSNKLGHPWQGQAQHSGGCQRISRLAYLRRLGSQPYPGNTQALPGRGLRLGLDQTVYALDATTIDLCLMLFPWAEFRQTKSAIAVYASGPARQRPDHYPHQRGQHPQRPVA